MHKRDRALVMVICLIYFRGGDICSKLNTQKTNQTRLLIYPLHYYYYVLETRNFVFFFLIFHVKQNYYTLFYFVGFTARVLCICKFRTYTTAYNI